MDTNDLIELKDLPVSTRDQRPIILMVPGVDKVLEPVMAKLTGYTVRALETKRLRGHIPPGVYATIDGRVTYSIQRYNEWVESQWPSPRGLKSLETRSESASCGTAAGDAKPSRSRRTRKVSNGQPIFVLQ